MFECYEKRPQYFNKPVHNRTVGDMSTLASVMPNLSASFVYFVEGNEQVHADIAAEYPEAKVKSIGAMTVISK